MTARGEVNGGAGYGRPPTEPDPGLEPLLWLQLLGLGAIPGEGLALLMLLGSVDPGPLPGLERLLIWALGALCPAVLLWKRAADPWSLLLLQAPRRGRRDIQRRLMRLQDSPVLRVLPLIAAALLLPVLWTIDQAGGLATALSPLAGSQRLVVLLLSVPLLAVIVWQCQQIGQALWLLSRPAEAIQAAEPLTTAEQEQKRLSLGLPLLLLDPLQAETPTARRAGTPETMVSASAAEAASRSTPTAQAPAQQATPTASRSSQPATVLIREDASAVREPEPVPEAETVLPSSLSSGVPEVPADVAGDDVSGDQALATEIEPAAVTTSSPGIAPEEDQAIIDTMAVGNPGQEQRSPDSDKVPRPGPSGTEPSGSDQRSGPGTVEPEQTAEDGESGDLDQEITGLQPRS